MAEPDVTWLNSEAQLIAYSSVIIAMCMSERCQMAFALFMNSTFKCRRQILKGVYIQAVGEFDLVGRE